MGKYADEFRKSYNQGRQDTRREIESAKIGGGMSQEYSRRIAKLVMFLSLLIGLFAFLYSWIIYKINFFLALLISFGVWWAGIFILGMLFALALRLARKADKSNAEYDEGKWKE
jgi:hypothetical protein